MDRRLAGIAFLADLVLFLTGDLFDDAALVAAGLMAEDFALKDFAAAEREATGDLATGLRALEEVEDAFFAGAG